MKIAGLASVAGRLTPSLAVKDRLGVKQQGHLLLFLGSCPFSAVDRVRVSMPILLRG
jgi:hypothetical protein